MNYWGDKRTQKHQSSLCESSTSICVVESRSNTSYNDTNLAL